jgi:hypothetical protein
MGMVSGDRIAWQQSNERGVDPVMGEFIHETDRRYYIRYLLNGEWRYTHAGKERVWFIGSSANTLEVT